MIQPLHEDPYRDCRQPAPPRVGNVRWTICALLFVATTINYMDRQVLSILKPTLQHSIGLSEQGYGNVIALFQVSYAVGLLLAGRLIDKLGSRLSATASSWACGALPRWATRWSARCSALAWRACCWAWVSPVTFPAAIKTVADWFPAARTLAGDRHLQRGCDRRCHHLPAHHSVDHDPLRLACGVSVYRPAGHSVDHLVGHQLSQARRPPHADRRGTAPHLRGKRPADERRPSRGRAC